MNDNCGQLVDNPKIDGRPAGYVAPSLGLRRLSGSGGYKLAVNIVLQKTPASLSMRAHARQMLIAAGLDHLLPDRESQSVTEAHRQAAYVAYCNRIEGTPVATQRVEVGLTSAMPAIIDEARWLATTRERDDDIPELTADEHPVIILDNNGDYRHATEDDRPTSR